MSSSVISRTSEYAVKASRRVAYLLRRPMLKALVDSAIARSGKLPVPTMPPRVRAMGADPQRVLLIGNGMVEGLGVATHELGIGGQLARRISASTARGVDIDLIGSQTMTLVNCRTRLESIDLSRYDAVILMIGYRETVGLEPRHVWNRELGELLDGIARDAPERLVTLLIQLPHFEHTLDMPSSLSTAIGKSVDRLNVVSADVVRTRPRVRLIPFAPAPMDQAPYGSVRAYEYWADLLAPEIADALRSQAPTVRPPEFVVEDDRQRALDRLHILDTPPDDRFDRIVQMARDALDATGAAMNFIDHDRQWTKASVPLGAPDNIDRVQAFCNTTIQRPELFVVEDLKKDAEFAEFPAVAGDLGLRFYAGYPVESPDGQRVGALCVVDTVPRQLSTSEAALLREFALQAQDLVWSLAG